jgi:hypothetical protein
VKDPGDVAARDCPAYPAWNVQKVTAGTGRPRAAQSDRADQRPYGLCVCSTTLYVCR